MGEAVPEPTLADLARRPTAVEVALGIDSEVGVALTLVALHKRLNRVETSLARLTATTDRIEAEQGALREDVTALRRDFSDLRGDFSDLRGDFSALRGVVEEVQVGLGAIGAQTTAILGLLRNPST